MLPCSGRTTTPRHPRAAPPIADVVRPQGGGTAAATRPAAPRIAFGSCAKQDRPQPIWDAVVATKPQLFLFLGDNIYADTEDMDVMRAKYALLAATRLQELKALPGPRDLGRPRLRRQRRRGRVPQEEGVAAGLPRLLRRPQGLAAPQAARASTTPGRRPPGEAGAGHPARHPLLPQPAEEEDPRAQGRRALRAEHRPDATMLGEPSGGGWRNNSGCRPRCA